MKSTKTLFLTALAVGSLLAFGTVANAGDTTYNPPSTPPAGGPPPGGQHGPGINGRPGPGRMLDQLNLTDDQKPKVQSIMKARMDKILSLRQDTTLSREDRVAKMKVIQEDTVKQMKAVLTADQFQKWQALQSQMRNRRNGPPTGGENAGGTNAPATHPKN